jgi:LacI family transcriptional regulator
MEHFKPETTFTRSTKHLLIGDVKECSENVYFSTSAMGTGSVGDRENVCSTPGGVVSAAGRRPTMKDVAALAGVSLATVSRVVNGNPDVRGDLALRVRDAVEVLGYRRDLTASTLRRTDRASASIGVVIADVANPFFSVLLRGIEDSARSRGVLVLAGSSDEDHLREAELAETFSARGVDGLVIVPCGADQGYLRRELDMGTAVVFADRAPRFIDADAVIADNVGGARAAVEHLVTAGHRRIGFLGDRQDLFTSAERRRGFREALAASGIDPDDALERTELVDSEIAESAAGALLDAARPPTALFAGQNLIAIGAMRALRERDAQREVALVSFDDIVLGDMVEPGLTVVRQSPYALGRHAAELLFSRLDGYAGGSRLIVVPTELVERGSGEIAAVPA